MSALTADQRAELRIVAEAAAADPDFDGDTVDSMAGLTPSYDDVFLPPTAIALLDALDAAEDTDCVSEHLLNEYKARVKSDTATLALADTLAADVGAPHPFKVLETNKHYGPPPRGECETCGLKYDAPVHGEPLRAFTAARK